MRGDGRAVTNLPGRPSAVPAARRFASQRLRDLGSRQDVVETTRLLVTEVTTNAVVHAHSSIRLTVESQSDCIRVEVRDDDPRTIEQPIEPGIDATSGRGLWLVAALARAWGVNGNDRGKTIWFEVD